MGNLGLIHDARGDLDGALRYYRDALAGMEKRPDSKPMEVGIVKSNIATVMRLRGQYDQADRMMSEAMDLLTKTLGADNVTYVAPARANLAELHRVEHRFADAEREIDDALAILQAKLPAGHVMTAWAEGVRGMILTDTGRAAAGEPFLRRALDASRRIFLPNDRRTALAAIQLGHCLTVQRKYAEAEALLTDGARDLAKAFGPDHPRSRLAQTWLAELKAAELPAGLLH